MEVHNTEHRKAGTYISRYRVENLIASGTFGKVYLSILNGKKYAIKEMIQPVKISHKIQMENQIKVLADMNHQNIVKLYQVIREGRLVHLVMEYCQSDMREFLAERQCVFTQHEVYGIIIQIINGMNQLVRHHIVHRDLKPANILYSNGRLKIADFGLAKYIQDQYQMLKTRVGTPFYMAPQILKNQRYTSKCDIWSLGIIFYQLIFGRLPWYATNQQQLMYCIYNIPLTFPKSVSTKTKKLLLNMIAIQQVNRYSWQQLLKEINSIDNKIKQNYELQRSFHHSTMQKLLEIQLNRISQISYGCKFDLIKMEEKKSMIGIVGKLFNQDMVETYNYFVKNKIKI